MRAEGGCYCSSVRYQIDGAPSFHGQCHCRECQYFTGGQANMLLGLPPNSFKITKGEDTICEYQNPDIEDAVTRQFCGVCGTPLWTLASHLSPLRILKVGTLDDPAVFGAPEFAAYTIDKQSFHSVPDGCSDFEGLPTRT